MNKINLVAHCDANAICPSFDFSLLTDPVWLKAHVFPRLLPRSRYAELLNNGIACMEVWDLLLVAAVEVAPNSWALLQSEPLRQAHISLFNLFQQAVKNMAETTTITPLSEVLAGLTGGSFGSSMFPPIFVIQSDVPYSAAAILSEDVRYKIHDIIGPEFYALPSSVHEMLAIPAGGDSNGLLDLVRTINASEVISDNDFLSDNVYYCKHGNVEVIA